MDIQRPDSIRWFSTGKKIHAVRFESILQKLEGETFCGMDVSSDHISDNASIDEDALCGRCDRGLRAWGYLPRYSQMIEEDERKREMANRKLIVAGVYLSDVSNALERRGIPLTEQNIKRAALHVENVASAYAKATLQDTTKEDWLDWIEPFPIHDKE